MVAVTRRTTDRRLINSRLNSIALTKLMRSPKRIRGTPVLN